MKISQLMIGDRSFHFAPEEIDNVLATTQAARASGEWLELHDVSGELLHILIPAEALVVIRERDIDIDNGADDGDPDWSYFDYET